MKKIVIALIATFGISGVAFADPTLDRSFNNVPERAISMQSVQQAPVEGLYVFNA